jgi:hypothetical protein
MPRYFKNQGLALYLKVDGTGSTDPSPDAQDKGLAVRVFTDGSDKRFETYTFGNRTIRYIADGLTHGCVQEISFEEFTEACRVFYRWAQNQVKNNFIV